MSLPEANHPFEEPEHTLMAIQQVQLSQVVSLF